MRVTAEDEQYIDGLRQSISEGFPDRGESKEELEEQHRACGLGTDDRFILNKQTAVNIRLLEDHFELVSQHGTDRDLQCGYVIIEDALKNMQVLLREIGYTMDDRGQLHEVQEDEGDS